MQSCRVLFPGSRPQMSVAKAGMLHQEADAAAAQLRIDGAIARRGSMLGTCQCP